MGIWFAGCPVTKKKNIFFVPDLTHPHVCRHTYCTNMALAAMNPKTLQYLMGHSEIGVTLDVYTHVSFEDARDEVEKMNIVQAEKQPKNRGILTQNAWFNMNDSF